MQAPQIYNTGDVRSKFWTALVYGLAGAGKTPLAATSPVQPLIVSSEPGLRSLAKHNIPYVQVANYKDSMNVLDWINGSREAKQYGLIFCDSISATSENILRDEIKKSRDPRKFSPETTGQTMEIVKGYLAIQQRHIIMTCKAMEFIDQVTNIPHVEPFAVVPKLGPALPYNFDLVAYMSRHRDQATGQEFAKLTCRHTDLTPQARTRSDALAVYEPADLTVILNKMNGAN